MTTRMKVIDVNVEFGTDPNIVIIRKSGTSNPIEARVLSVEKDHRGKPSKVYLRSKIFNVSESLVYTGWIPSGSVTTILTKA